ncbi:cytochrome c1 [Mangrovitalea sediminis]|uniref:cytochrome c1 n=1 Tax=Mangrovitalea sediminis TaxID=1982043 RepID=UPI000BE58DE9|nr:cytochrome c1 [Mangrovitalea sediminis]
MKKLMVLLTLLLVPVFAVAAEDAIPLDHMTPDLHDKASLQRGDKYFTNYCMGCHSAKYMRYQRVAKDLGIPNELYEKNLIFTGAKIGELMDNAMSPSQATGWFGKAPPDLTLEGRLRGADWIYSYLKGFYKDDSRPRGVNNVVFPKVAMPHVLVNLQGLCAEPPRLGAKPHVDPMSGDVRGEGGCSKWAQKGSMTPQQYDQVAYDITNFLFYMGEPIKLQRERLGTYVLIFIAIFFVFAYLLNREYWKDVH